MLWSFQSGALPHNTITITYGKEFQLNDTKASYKNYLLVINAQHRNSGVYICDAKNKYGGQGTTLILTGNPL